MQEQSSVLDERKAQFEALCSKYGLPEGVGKEALFGLSLSGGMLASEAYEKQVVFDLAKMLKQLSFSKGDLSLVVGGVPKDYGNPNLVEVLRQSLVDALKARVVRREETWVDVAHYNYNEVPEGTRINRGATMRVSIEYPFGVVEKRIYAYPPGVHPEQDSFSNEELDAIIDYGTSLGEEIRKLRGNVKNKTAPTRSADLGRLVLILNKHLPEDWIDEKRYSFLAEYLLDAGVLNFKGESWLVGFSEKSPNERCRDIRYWIKTYREKNPQ